MKFEIKELTLFMESLMTSTRYTQNDDIALILNEAKVGDVLKQMGKTEMEWC